MRGRIAGFVGGLALCGLGVAMMTRTGLGTAPVSTVPYVLSRILPLSFGACTALLNLGLVGVQKLLLGRRFDSRQYLQLLVAPGFGAFVDLGMWLTPWCANRGCAVNWGIQLAGCWVLALGLSLMLAAELSYLPAEGLIRTVAQLWNRPFGPVKIAFDVLWTVLAAGGALAFLARVEGVREGTVLAAFAVGFFVSRLLPRLRSRGGRRETENPVSRKVPDAPRGTPDRRSRDTRDC